MKPLFRWLWPLFAALPLLAQAAATEEKIIFIRHGEKPALGLGMLNCQGLNRALALPAVLVGKFGKPDFVFASDPHEQKVDGGQAYNYVRPLLTVAPTAVQLGLPINTSLGYDDIAGLQQELADPRYHAATVLVAWEHKMIEDLVKAMLQKLGSADKVPHWKGEDFDSIYVVTVRRDGGATSASFALEHEQLNGQSSSCPVPAAKP
ncbi:histidine phosphatase family protein [Rhodoferax sp.]|uniref:histidine phosphatase family protein n=1 Tax=Rhodoferax sp. TaxID=50421 RepID=UPI00374CC6D2